MATPLVAEWICDGSDDPLLGEKQTIFTAEELDNGTKLLDVQANLTRPSNFLYKLDNPAQRFFLDVTVEKLNRGSSLSVGVAKRSDFNMGFGTKGMFYNGNLTSGKAALKKKYGPFAQERDSILVEYSQGEESIDVTFYFNGECLGTGFRVPKEEEPFFPEISITGEVRVRALVTDQFPTAPVFGDWKTDGSDADKKMTYTLESSIGGGLEWLEVTANKTQPSNFLYEMEKFPNKFDIDVDIEKMTKGSGLSIGVAKLSNFKMGSETKGLFYNGKLQEGDSVRLEYALGDTFMEINFYAKGKRVGKGFRVRKEAEPFFPVLSITGDVRVKVNRWRPKYALDNSTPTVLRNTFKLTEAHDKSGKAIIPVKGGNEDIKVVVNPKAEDQVTLTVSVCNILSILKTHSEIEGGISLFPIERGPGVTSTKRKAPPLYEDVEKRISECMETEWSTMELYANGKELIILNGNAECVAKGEKDTQREPALTSY